MPARLEPLSHREAQAKWDKIKHKIPRDGNKVVIDAIPYELRSWFKNKQKKCLQKKSIKYRMIKSLDDRIYLHKWYPWSYKGYQPQLVLMGWYSVKRAKKIMLAKFGKDALKDVKFVKGKEALERGFTVGPSLYINGKWEMFKLKMAIPKHTREVGSRNTIKIRVFGYEDPKERGTNPLRKERMLEKNHDTYEYGFRDYIPKVKPKKRIRIQASKKVELKREKSLYEEE